MERKFCMKLLRLFKLIPCLIIFLFVSCQLSHFEERVDLEIFLPYLSENPGDLSRAISSAVSGEIYDFDVEFIHLDSSESFILKGKSGSTLRTEPIRAGKWAINLNAYMSNVLTYSAATRVTLRNGEEKTLSFSFSKAGNSEGAGSSGNNGNGTVSSPIFNNPTDMITSNISFKNDSSIRADTSVLSIDLSQLDSKYLSNAVIALYNSEDSLITNKQIPSDILTSESKVIQLNVFLTKGSYYLSIFQNSRRTSVSGTITVYNVASITKIYVPDAGLSYANQKLPVIISGANLQSDDFNVYSLSVSGDATISGSFQILDDNRILCYITCPDTPGEKQITANYNDKYIVSKTFNVFPAEKCIYQPGDIILKDGTRIPATTTSLTETEKENAVAIVGATMYGGGTVLGAALELSDLISFAKTDTPNISKAGITSTTTYDKNYNYVIKLGNENPFGLENFDYITQIHANAANDPDNEYPVFTYADKYGENNNLTGDYATDWFIPSHTELYEIMNNHVVLNTKRSLLGKEKIGIMDYFKETGIDTGRSYSFYTYYYIYSSTYSDSNHVYVSYIDANSDSLDTDDSDNPVNCDSFGATGKLGNAKYRHNYITYEDMTVTYGNKSILSNSNSSWHKEDVYCGQSSDDDHIYGVYYPKAMPVHLIPIK